MISVIALIVAALFPIAFLYAVNAMDLYRTGTSRLILLSGVWGVIAYYLAYFTNTTLVANNIISSDTLVRFVAPPVEELLKGLLLIYLVRRDDFRYFVDGAIYGFASGIGFAIFENFEYVLGHPSTALALAISRVLSTNLIHATGTGLIGIALGLSRFDRSALHRVLYLLGGLVLAVSIHMGFNNLVNSGVALAFAFAAGLTGGGIIALAIRRGLHEEKNWIKEKLGMQDRVTSREAAVVQQLNKVNSILEPLAQRFGADKASQIEQFLVMQAQLGILRKMLDKMQDEKMQAGINSQIGDLRLKMDTARRAVGAYCMVYLRTIFPEDDETMMALIQNRIEASAIANKGKAGTGVWDLSDRLKPKSVTDQNK